MYKKIVIVFSFLFTFLLLSCNQNVNSPNNIITNNNSSLLKMGWNYTSVDWPYTKFNNGCWADSIELSSPSLSTTYKGYIFKFVKDGYILDQPTYTISVYVNNTKVGTMDDNNTSLSFNYDNKSMDVDYALNFYNYTRFNTCSDTDESFFEPSLVDIAIYDYVNPDAPTGFSVSPHFADNLNQAVTISWNISTDPDVTGYKIYRKLQTETEFSLVQTINSRTTSSWIDYNVPWSTSNPEMTITYYKMVAFDGTHNLSSDYTTTLSSALP